MAVILDMSATSLDEIADIVIDSLINNGSLPWEKKDQVSTAVNSTIVTGGTVVTSTAFKTFSTVLHR